jgi:hypothetical protein
MKESKTKKTKGYKEVITYGNFPYKLPITDSRGITKEVEFVATLVESVPDHKECNQCKKFLAKDELRMAPHIINCNHHDFTEDKINERAMSYKCEECGGSWPANPKLPYWTPIGTQEYMCFECYGHLIDQEQQVGETTWYGVTL